MNNSGFGQILFKGTGSCKPPQLSIKSLVGDPVAFTTGDKQFIGVVDSINYDLVPYITFHVIDSLGVLHIKSFVQE